MPWMTGLVFDIHALDDRFSVWYIHLLDDSSGVWLVPPGAAESRISGDFDLHPLTPLPPSPTPPTPTPTPRLSPRDWRPIPSWIDITFPLEQGMESFSNGQTEQTLIFLPGFWIFNQMPLYYPYYPYVSLCILCFYFNLIGLIYKIVEV